MKNILFSIVVLLIANSMLHAQDKSEKEYVYHTFKDTRIINTYSVETLQKRQLDFRVSHRFGDFINNWTFNNAWATFFGLENAADVSIGLEYGITNNLMIGINRTAGYGPLKSNINTLIKYKILSQTKGAGMPLTLTAAATASISTMLPVDNDRSLASFNKVGSPYEQFAARMSYSVQLHAARKFSDRFSLQLSPTFVWRNLVQINDENALFSMGVVAKFQATKVLGIIIDANIPFDELRWQANSGYHIPIGIGFEFDTGGHVFQINLTNSAGLAPTDYIPNTDLNWGLGQFRLGFTIARAFRV
jgi:opacity protein-like surface antigen